MAKMKFEGVDELIRQIELVERETLTVIDRTIAKGAGVVADTFRGAVQALPVDDSSYKKGGTRKGIRTLQKKGLEDSLGISPMRLDGNFYNRKVGFDGYNSMITKAWPKGQPNPMIARAINSGTSFLPKTGFSDKATRTAKRRAEEAMRLECDAQIQKLVK